MLANSESNTKGMDAIIKQHLSHPDILIYAIKDAAENKQWTNVKKFAEVGLEQKFAKKINEVLYHYLLEAAVQTKIREDIIKYAELLFFVQYDSQYLDIILNQLKKKEGTVYLESLIDRLEDSPFHTMKKDAIAEIYFKLNAFEDLINYIKKIKSLDLLQKSTPKLIENHMPALKKVYVELIKDYLSFHLGPIPRQKVRVTLLNLRKLGAHKLLHYVSDKLVKEFPERRNLHEELEIL